MFCVVDDDVLETMAFKDEAKEEEEGDLTREQAGAMAAVENPEEDAVLREVGLRGHSKRRREPGAAPLPSTTPPQDRFRLYDTPGAINDAQVSSSILHIDTIHQHRVVPCIIIINNYYS